MVGVGFRLGIDFGTSNTVAMLVAPDGRVRQLLVDGSPVLPSSVCLTSDGQLLVGRDAVHASRATPEGYEPHPKQRISQGTVRLGRADVPVGALFAAVLSRVAGEARRVAGGAIESVTLTYPAGWDRQRCGVLHAAAVQVGLGPAMLIPEPVAAAWSFLNVAGGRMPIGAALAVYDFGGGTFDASVVRRSPHGFEVLASDGLTDTGGLTIDSAIVAYLGSVYKGRDPAIWRRLTEPETGSDRRASRLMWDDVRSAKEMLSRQPATLVHIPLLDVDAPIGREQFNELARPILVRTIDSMKAVLGRAGVPPGGLAGVFLVGGSSRIPLAATLLHQQLQLAPTVVESPELAVADGSLRAPRGGPGPGPGPAPGYHPAHGRPGMPPVAPGGRPPPGRAPYPGGWNPGQQQPAPPRYPQPQHPQPQHPVGSPGTELEFAL